MTAGVAKDLTLRLCPMEPILARVDPLLTTPITLTTDEFNNLLAFCATDCWTRALNQRICASWSPRLSRVAFRSSAFHSVRCRSEIEQGSEEGPLPRFPSSSRPFASISGPVPTFFPATLVFMPSML